MKKLCLGALIGFLLSGCTANGVLPEEPKIDTIGSADSKFQLEGAPRNDTIGGDDGQFQPQAATKASRTVNSRTQQPNSWSQSFDTVLVKNINHYVRGVMHDLVDNLHYVNSQTPIGVSSFVFIDSDLHETSILGQQITESFIHEIHQFGIPVIDYKVMDNLQVTPDGDFIFSRDYRDLNGSVPIQYILTGTLTRHQGGYLLNARIIGLVSKAVVASAQGFIPNRVADAIIEHETNDGILLIQG